MKVNKLIKSKIERDYFFVKGKLSIDCKYFITEIEKGIKREDNQSFKTNLISEMTSYRYFIADKKFQEMWDKQNEYYGNIYEIYVYKTIITDSK